MRSFVSGIVLGACVASLICLHRESTSFSIALPQNTNVVAQRVVEADFRISFRNKRVVVIGGTCVSVKSIAAENDVRWVIDLSSWPQTNEHDACVSELTRYRTCDSFETPTLKSIQTFACDEFPHAYVVYASLPELVKRQRPSIVVFKSKSAFESEDEWLKRERFGCFESVAEIVCASFIV